MTPPNVYPPIFMYTSMVCIFSGIFLLFNIIALLDFLFTKGRKQLWPGWNFYRWPLIISIILPIWIGISFFSLTENIEPKYFYYEIQWIKVRDKKEPVFFNDMGMIGYVNHMGMGKADENKVVRRTLYSGWNYGLYWHEWTFDLVNKE